MLRGLDMFSDNVFCLFYIVIVMLEVTVVTPVVGFEVLDAECEENSCVVSVSRDVKINVYIPGMDRSKPINSVVQQVWVKTDGQWGYVKLK